MVGAGFPELSGAVDILLLLDFIRTPNLQIFTIARQRSRCIASKRASYDNTRHPLARGQDRVHPGEKRGEDHATLHGSLMGLLDFVNDAAQPGTDRVITSVASGSRE